MLRRWNGLGVGAVLKIENTQSPEAEAVLKIEQSLGAEAVLKIENNQSPEVEAVLKIEHDRKSVPPTPTNATPFNTKSVRMTVL